MKGSKTKRSMYLWTFSWLLSIWLILMLCFSTYLLHGAKKSAENTFVQDSNLVGSILSSSGFDNADDYKLQEALISLCSRTFSTEAFDFSVYSKDYNLVFHKGDTWICSYNIPNGVNSWKQGYAYLYPEKWLSEAQIKDITYYLSYEGTKKLGELSHYYVNMSFWMDGTEVIPDKIETMPMYITSLDEKGNETGSSGTDDKNNSVFESGYQNVSGLTYYEHGQIQAGCVNSVENSMTHSIVTDNERLENAVTNFTDDLMSGSLLHSEKIGLFTEQYYMVRPYNNVVKQINGKFVIDYWIAVSGECNYLLGMLPTMLIVWLMCLCLFSGTAWILSSQTWKTYLRHEELEQQRTDTTNAIAHDLKTSLAAISGYAENLINNVHTEKREHYAERFRDNAQRMDQIIQEMISLSRFESGTLEICPEEFSLKEVTDTVAIAYLDAFAEKDISFSIRGDAEITADKALISRAINNFVCNASANTGNGGKIEITIENRRWSITYTRNQISEDQLTAIWQANYKTDAARSNPEGSGLGLSIVKSIMDLHGFKYGLKSISDGPCFWFEFLNK